jgi:hypothetical protein
VTIVRVGATEKYSAGWDKAFGKAGGKSSSGAKAPLKAATAKPASAKKKAAGKKKKGKK